MAYIVEVDVASPLASYPSAVEFEAAVRATIDPEVNTIINTALATGDLENFVRNVSEDATDYHFMSTYNWKDEATYLVHHNDPSIVDDQADLEAAFVVTRTLP